jgi:hypothetical protein
MLSKKGELNRGQLFLPRCCVYKEHLLIVKGYDNSCGLCNMSAVYDISKSDLVNDDDGNWREVGTVGNILFVCLACSFRSNFFLLK